MIGDVFSDVGEEEEMVVGEQQVPKKRGSERIKDEGMKYKQ